MPILVTQCKLIKTIVSVLMFTTSSIVFCLYVTHQLPVPACLKPEPGHLLTIAFGTEQRSERDSKIGILKHEHD